MKLGAGGAILGIAAVTGISALGQSNRNWNQTASSEDYDWDAHQWGFVVNTEACIGCGRCVKACKIENNVPMQPHTNRTWVERYVIDEKGEAHVDSPDAGINGFDDTAQKYPGMQIEQSFFVPKLCNQCENPPCVQVCPVAATYKTKDGIVLIDQNRCVGCRYCIQACPYSARYFHPEKGVADKCTWCYHRITKGLDPACVEVCPVGARKFGNLKDPESPIKELIKNHRAGVLKPDLGTRPKVSYIGLTKEVV